MKFYKNMSLANKILLLMVVGVVFGFAFKGYYNYWSVVTTPVGDIFLRLLKMTILPLVFFSIISGISSIADMKRLKKIGGRFLVFWAIASVLSALVGIFWAYILKPGIGVSIEAPAKEYSTEGVSILTSLVHWIPDNIFVSFTEFNLIQVIVFAMFIGVAITQMPEGKIKSGLTHAFDAGNTLMTSIIEIVMGFSPIGVLCLMANVTGSLGSEVLGALGKMLLTQYIAYATLVFVIFPAILVFIAKVNPVQHYKNIFPVMIMAFSSCSSSLTLPTTMKCTKERCGVPSENVDLIAPPAATINMQACCAEMPIYAIFAAQLFGVNYEITDLIVIIIMGCMMAAGAAGVPGGGIMMSAIMMQTMGLPLTIVPWVAGIYRLIDMPNTTLNVTGDTVGMVTVSSLLGDLKRDVFNAKKPIFTNEK